MTDTQPPRIIPIPYQIWNGLAKRAKMTGTLPGALAVRLLGAWLEHQDDLDLKLAGVRPVPAVLHMEITPDPRPESPAWEEPAKTEAAAGTYRRRTTIVQALQWLGRDQDRLPMRTFLNDDRHGGSLALQVLDDDRIVVLVPTRTAHRTVALPGDWVVRDPVQGYLVCQEIDFPILYEPVTSPDSGSVLPVLPG